MTDIIIGAGVSGISYANFTENEYIILERDDSIGGYCKTIKKNGYVWDYSGHFFHFQNPELEKYVCKNIDPATLRKVNKKTQILYKGHYIDFPFQKNIHQLDKEEFIDCLYDLFVTDDIQPDNFKNMIYQNLGKSIAEKFLVPYNEKLYACDLNKLDVNAMGRFFPKASKDDIIRNFRNSDNQSYNSFFTYPEGGAIEYIKSLASNIDSDKIFLNEQVEQIDPESKTVRTNKRTLRYDHLISTIPFPKLLDICSIEYDKQLYTCNKVMVFNLGFDRKGHDTINHWVYIPDKEIIFYRIGYYDNIIQSDKMSLYIEIGFSKETRLKEKSFYLERIMRDLKKTGIVRDEQLVAYHSVVMDPAYVHISKESVEDVKRLKNQLALYQIYPIGRYGSWTYCSIEDNIKEAQETVQTISKK